ncbi:TYRO protein tyrosine kinase-binding protein [Anomalospiza imberbis]|uniref:TYRO protein tyrosine kinase-binding protein n=1 Tax=Anomalospiza imberbis TaxID=187417 RepID=UPI00358F46C0
MAPPRDPRPPRPPAARGRRPARMFRLPPGPGPIAALVAADVIMTLLIAGAAYWLAGRGRRAPPKPRPPEQDSPYQGAAGRARGRLQRAQALSAPCPAASPLRRRH